MARELTWNDPQKGRAKIETMSVSAPSSNYEIKQARKGTYGTNTQKQQSRAVRQQYNMSVAMPKAAANIRRAKPEGRKAVKQDERWGRMWQAYMDYMGRYRRRPSRHHAEDMKLFDWFKHTKKLLNQGKLRADRAGKFMLLLDEAKDFQRINQHYYVNSSIKVEEPPIHLYDYQADMKQRIEQAFLYNGAVMAQMPTGTGKTHVIASVVRDFVRDGMGSVWVVAHRRELVSQIKKTLGLYLTDGEMQHIQATSIQWLASNYQNIEDEPGLIVIDEAHHAVAKTYADVMNAYSMAKKLGVTATPYRLSGAGFKDLFGALLTSPGIKTFIQEGYLCPFDYYCITQKSVEKTKVDGLKKRGTDGDYQPKELNENFNQSVMISRLFDCYQQFATGKRGFVYAISISHAENIAKYYSEHGVKTVAVSSKTPDAKRESYIEAFKKGEITVLCSVDLFSEGFDAPDAEFIQIARPTLSLAKYLQMVGRGLRVAKGKKSCVILDNVGLKDRFGLPSKERNWEYYFNGEWKKRRTQRIDFDDDANLAERTLGSYVGPENTSDMALEASHEELKTGKEIQKTYKVVEAPDGRQGISTRDGETILPSTYDHISINEQGIAGATKDETTRWYDLLNGVWYDSLPDLGYIGSVPMAFVKDRFYPRLKSRWIDADSFITTSEMRYQFGHGIDWNGLFISWDGKPKVLKVIDSRQGCARMLSDDEGKRYVQRNPRSKPVSAAYVKDIEEWFEKRKAEYDDFVERARRFPVEYADTDVEKLQQNNRRIWKDEYGIITVTPSEGKQYWIDAMSGRVFHERPTAATRGNAELLYIGDFVFIRKSAFRVLPYQDWQISSDGVSVFVANARY